MPDHAVLSSSTLNCSRRLPLTSRWKSRILSQSGKLSSFAGVASSTSARATLKYSVSQITTCRSSLESDLQYWKQAGIPAIGLWRRKLDDVDSSGAIDLIRESGLQVSSLSFAGGFTGSNGFKDREAVEDAVDAVFQAAAVGARTLIVAPGARGRFTPGHGQKLIVHSLREVAMLAEQLGVDLAILPKPRPYAKRWTGLYSLDAAMDLIDTVARPNVKLVIDTFDFMRTDADVARLADYIGSTAIVQISDSLADARSEYDRCLPGQGCLPLDDVLNVLAAERFSGYLDLQIWSDQFWCEESLDALHACRESMKRLLAGSRKSPAVPMTGV